MDKKIILIVIFAFALRIPFMSLWLEDWDSVQFAMAMHNYSLADGIPHPPGYPLYILIGKFLYLFFQDDNKALTFLSALLGSLSTIPLYLLSKKMFNNTIALLSSLFFILTPVHWSLSEVALTNIPGQFFLLTLIYLLYIFRQRQNFLILVSLMFGLMLGVRFTEFSIIILLLGFVLLYQKDLKLIFFCGLSFGLGILAWLLPLITLTGLENFIKAYTANASYIVKHDALLNMESFRISTVRVRLTQLILLLKMGYTAPFIIVTFLSSLKIILNKELMRDFRFQFLIIWLISYLIPLIFFFNQEVTRYTLPLLPPLAILGSFIIFNAIKNRYILIVSTCIILLILFFQSFDQVNRFKKTIPPAIAPILFVKDNFNPDEILIISTLTLRHFQYYAPEFNLMDLDKINSVPLDTKVVVIDNLSTIDKIPELKKYQIQEEKRFYGDKDIYNRVDSTSLYVLSKKGI